MYMDARAAPSSLLVMDKMADMENGISATALYAHMGSALLLTTNDLPGNLFSTLVHAQVCLIHNGWMGTKLMCREGGRVDEQGVLKDPPKKPFPTLPFQ